VTIEKRAEAYANEKWPGVGQIYWRSLIEAAVIFGYHLRMEETQQWGSEHTKIRTFTSTEPDPENSIEVDFEFE
jgi:hypothetical protein